MHNKCFICVFKFSLQTWKWQSLQWDWCIVGTFNLLNKNTILNLDNQNNYRWLPQSIMQSSVIINVIRKNKQEYETAYTMQAEVGGPTEC